MTIVYGGKDELTIEEGALGTIEAWPTAWRLSGASIVLWTGQTQATLTQNDAIDPEVN
jgi:hypothetical protein